MIKTVFTNGCFDILHRGHVSYLKAARELGDRLVVGLDNDESVRILKGDGRPINSQEDRRYVLSELRCVDEVVFFHTAELRGLIHSVHPDILVKGGDWSIENIVGHDIVQGYGGTVVSLPYVDGYSTTGIIERMRRNYDRA